MDVSGNRRKVGGIKFSLSVFQHDAVRLVSKHRSSLPLLPPPSLSISLPPDCCSSPERKNRAVENMQDNFLKTLQLWQQSSRRPRKKKCWTEKKHLHDFTAAGGHLRFIPSVCLVFFTHCFRDVSGHLDGRKQKHSGTLGCFIRLEPETCALQGFTELCS